MVNPNKRSFLKALGGSLFAFPFLPGNSLYDLSMFFMDWEEKNTDLLLPKPTLSQNPTQKLTLYNTHTGEWLKNITFWENGKFIPSALHDINFLCRDHRTHEVNPMDTKLLSVLVTMMQTLKIKDPIHLVSGYRSPKTNKLLRKGHTGVAENSQHTLGRAVDFFIETVDLSRIHKVALKMKSGGVGLYRDFIHIDTGPVRRWGLRA